MADSGSSRWRLVYFGWRRNMPAAAALPAASRSFCMPLWVHIEPSVSPDGDEAKAALTSSLKTSLTRTLVTMTSEALPPDRFTTKPEDKPKPKPKPKGAKEEA